MVKIMGKIIIEIMEKTMDIIKDKTMDVNSFLYFILFKL